MAAPRILLIYSGHSFSTLDVCEGLAHGLAANGAEVVPWHLHTVQQTLHQLRGAAEQIGMVAPEDRERLKGWITNIASADAVTLALLHEVDAVVAVYGLLFPVERVRALRQLGIPVACYGTEAPYIRREFDIAPHYSHWFTNERRSVAAFRQAGANAHYLAHAYHPHHHRPAAPDPALACDVTFVGGFYAERKALLGGVDWAGMGVVARFDGTLKDSNDPHAGAMTNADVTRRHQSARIALNIHRTTGDHFAGEQIDPTLASCLNPRAYEIPAAGGFMLCDDSRPELTEVFGDSAATFRAGDSADLARQCRYWLDHPDARDRQAAAQHQAIQPHHWGNRARTVLETLF